MDCQGKGPVVDVARRLGLCVSTGDEVSMRRIVDHVMCCCPVGIFAIVSSSKKSKGRRTRSRWNESVGKGLTLKGKDDL